MVTNREFIRKLWEELMKNPLAMELWVTEAANFDDPTYHPSLHLVVDSDDVTVIDVDAFEEFYSDEETNYWNGIVRGKASDFDPSKVSTRRLTCVYRQGQWLDNRVSIVADEVSVAKAFLKRTLQDFRNFPCESTVSLLLIRLFETMQMIRNYEERYSIDYDCARYRVPRKEVFARMRNALVYCIWEIDDFSKFIKGSLIELGKESFNKVCELCFEEKCDLYSELMDFLVCKL